MDAPDFILPYIGMFYEPQEIDLLAYLGKSARSVQEITEELPVFAEKMSTETGTRLDRSFRRGVIDPSPEGGFFAL